MVTLSEYIKDTSYTSPCFVLGDSLKVLATIPNESIDCVITSPPYYMKREYLAGGIGLERTYNEYIDSLLKIIKEV